MEIVRRRRRMNHHSCKVDQAHGDELDLMLDLMLDVWPGWAFSQNSSRPTWTGRAGRWPWSRTRHSFGRADRAVDPGRASTFERRAIGRRLGWHAPACLLRLKRSLEFHLLWSKYENHRSLISRWWFACGWHVSSRLADGEAIRMRFRWAFVQGWWKGREEMMNCMKNCWLPAYLLDWRCSNSEFWKKKNKQTEDAIEADRQRSQRRVTRTSPFRGSA